MGNGRPGQERDQANTLPGHFANRKVAQPPPLQMTKRRHRPFPDSLAPLPGEVAGAGLTPRAPAAAPQSPRNAVRSLE